MPHYRITNQDGSPVEGEFVVLRIDTDEVARFAALVYAQAVEGRSPDVSTDIREAVRPFMGEGERLRPIE